MAYSTLRSVSVSTTADYPIACSVAAAVCSCASSAVVALAAATGVALVAPAAWIEWGGAGEASWWMSGVALVLGATGVALLWTGIAGLPPDYIDADE